MRPVQRLQHSELLGHHSRRWFGNITPPVPTRICRVRAATAPAASTVGAEPTAPGRWVSDTQKRL